MKTMLMAVLVGSAALVAGCSSATSPLDDKSPSAMTGTQVGVLAGGTAAGAAVGDAIGGTKGAVIGGAVGLAGSALAYNAVVNHEAEQIKEAEEKGRRAGRVEVFEQMWDEQARSPGAAPNGMAGDSAAVVAYPASTIEGVKLAPRQGTSTDLGEPGR